VIASSRTQVIQSLEGGIAAEIRVREGDVVDKGQVLVRLDRTKVEASYLESRARSVGLEALLLRLKAETFGTPLRFPPAMLKNYSEITTAQQTLYAKRQRALQAELAKAEEDFAGIEQVVTQRKDQLDRIELTAPVRGIVKNVRVTTVGGVVRPGDEVMQIVPTQDNLLIEAKLRPADVAFLKPGLPATIKLDAYDYTIYGTLKGHLTYISADTFSEENRVTDQTYYRAHIQTTDRRLSTREGEKIEIIPGMTATVEVTTGSNTVLHYLIKPITKAANEALRER
jgi:membrane fusion protein, adhesin transport system